MALDPRIAMGFDTSQISNPVKQQAQQQELALGNQKLQSGGMEIQNDKVERAARYLSMASPENWPAIRSRAIGEGLGDEATIPPDFDEAWVNKARSAFDSHKAQTPSAIQEYQYYQGLDPVAQQKYLEVKRNTQYLNAGDKFIAPSTGETIIKGVSPDATPELKFEQAKQTEVGKQKGEALANLNADEAAMPQLEEAVKTLSDLGKKATYTTAGRAVNALVRESGLGATGGDVARSAYIAHVKNNVLPLLRRTFGAQFTKAEGDSLLATLGDPNSSPEQKDATLKAFIEDKRATLETMRRQSGQSPGGEATPAEETKVIGGKTYHKINGKWHE